MNRFYLSIVAPILLAMPAAAQFQGNVYVEDSTIKVWAAGHQNQLAWAGGFNNPQFAMGDLNHDGKPDMVVYENLGLANLVRTFINTGTATQAHYTYMPKYALNFPAANNYLKLEDYNRDGISDMITRGTDGFTIYKGGWNAQNELSFTYFKALRFNAPGLGNINAYSDFIPGVVDVDGDGDLDFFGYDVNGSVISFYKNCQVEHGLPNDSIEVCWPTRCWGDMYQGFVKPFNLGVAPGSTNCPMNFTFSCKGAMHGGNNIAIFDYDGDGDMDMLDGNFSYNDIQFVKNGKAEFALQADSMVSQDTSWQSNGHQLYMPTFPAPFYLDADGDGKKDILITPQAGAGSENNKCIAFYKNTGTTAAPVFTYQSDSFLIDHSIDVGTMAYPVLYDYNKDGRLDLIIGSEGYYQPNGTYRSKLSYYQNTLVGTTTQLVLQTTDLANTFAQNFWGSAPAVGDLDGDGKDDLVLGHVDGTLSFYKNMAPLATSTPQWQLSQTKMKKNNGDTIRVGYSATPFIYDINKDGKPDLLVGHMNGGVFYYQNTTTGSGLSLQQVTNMLGGMNVNYMAPGFGGYSVPFIGRMDNTNKDYILLGSEKGNVLRYDGFQSGNTNMPYNLIDTLYSHIDVGDRAAIAVGDIDKDGKYDMVIGNVLGGVQLFKQVLNPASVNPGPFGSSSHCALFPNPATDAIYFTWDSNFSGTNPVSVRIINMAGQSVAEQVFEPGTLDGMMGIKHLAVGTYIGYINSGSQRFASRFTIVR